MSSVAKAISHPEDPAKLKSLLLDSHRVHEELRQQLHTALEALRLEKQRTYGRSGEKSPGQAKMFDEAELPVEDTQDETTPVASHQCCKNATRKPLPNNLDL